MLYRFAVLIVLFALASGCNDTRCKPDKVSGRILAQFSKQMQKKGLSAVGKGGGCSRDTKIYLISITLDYYEEMDIQSARRLIVESTQTLLNLINSDPKNKEYFEQFPAKVNTVFLAIIGQPQKNINSDYIFIVDIINGILYYKIDIEKSPSSPFTTIHQETFEEAQRILAEQSV